MSWNEKKAICFYTKLVTGVNTSHVGHNQQIYSLQTFCSLQVTKPMPNNFKHMVVCHCSYLFQSILTLSILNLSMTLNTNTDTKWSQSTINSKTLSTHYPLKLWHLNFTMQMTNLIDNTIFTQQMHFLLSFFISLCFLLLNLRWIILIGSSTKTILLPHTLYLYEMYNQLNALHYVVSQPSVSGDIQMVTVQPASLLNINTPIHTVKDDKMILLTWLSLEECRDYCCEHEAINRHDSVLIWQRTLLVVNISHHLHTYCSLLLLSLNNTNKGYILYPSYTYFWYSWQRKNWLIFDCIN